ncbi:MULTISPECIES: hypothetical protein [Reichenbachiella]|uniref:Uncharacterized protein n=1 Tax=Reichenbachiella agariperforans TaxID=156994 RepID=A0A1M6L499_REIAG|nr:MULTISPECIES: hypothetical protein [Reichenbachiella]MBU2913784.1 hypothetical protein [Reichenbachiella agariperforans]SHJ66075.1 hypothetical protein SAMN04488028_101819 [Reichenbachiella agariperforans]
MENCNKCEKRAVLKCRGCGRMWCKNCHAEVGKPGLFAGKCGVCEGIVVRLEHV